MDWVIFHSFMILCLAASTKCSELEFNIHSKVYNVYDFGAVGDGKTDDSQAFLKAWRAMCVDNSQVGELTIPRTTFLLNPVTFKGPCKSSSVHVHVLADIIAPLFPKWGSLRKDKWLEFSHVNGLIIDGPGKINGQGSEWWSSCGGKCTRPTALSFHDCDGLQLSGLKFENSQRNHISINTCNGAILSNLQITAPENSPNTDGIDISNSTNIQIQDSFIGTGDDCVAITDGTSYINITHVQCGPGHGISVGSLGEHGAHATAEKIHVKNCNFTRTMNGVRIKTWEGGSGYARKITFEQIQLNAVKNPIIIDQYYVDKTRDPSQASAVQVSDITYIGVHGSSTKENAINLSCSRSVACTNIIMEQINIQSVVPGNKTYSSCINAHGRSKDTNPDVPCLS